MAHRTDIDALDMIGSRIRRERLNQNRTQAEIAAGAGVALNVLKRLESGRGCSLRNFIRLLRSLGRLGQLELLLPEPGVSPLQLAAFEGRQRKEATGRRGRGRKAS